MRKKLKNLSLTSKTWLTIMAILCLILISINVFSALYTKNIISNKVNIQLKERLHQINEQLESYDDLLKSVADSLFEAFKVKFNDFELDTSKEVIVKGVKTPLFSSDGIILNNNFDIVDHYTKIKGSTATIFARKGDDFVRITTSLKRHDGSRTLGTYLGKKSPAYDAIMNKKRYFGSAHLFGNEYMAVYDPIIKNGEVIGILYVGYNYTKNFEKFIKRLKSIVIGDTGYLYILSSKAKEKGLFVLHPTKEGKNIFKNSKRDLSHIEAMYKKDHGILTYNWTNPKTNKKKKKTVIYETYKDRSWIIVLGSTVDEFLKESEDFTYILIFMSIASIIITSFLILIIVKKIVIVPLHGLQDGLIKFFDYLNRKTENTENILIKSNDEIGLMSNLINNNISEIEKNIQIDNSLIKETANIASLVKEGHLNKQIEGKTNNPALNNLKDVVNDMLLSINMNTNKIQEVLTSFSEYDYTPRLSSENIEAQMKILFENTNILGENTTIMLQDNLKTGQILKNNSQELSTIINKLSESSTHQAASLEETAASLEELTSSMNSNEKNVDNISQTANNLLQEIKSGRHLADKTAESMDLINEQTNAIAEAITIIDQIAFQTNILSLNAAVEAATAGEAGKGFAVVAQEVRNLASRSAEAAKEIKDLVENATSRANDGKNTVTNMIGGYESLDENVHLNAQMMEDISRNFQEQVRGIEQINDTVASLDKITQENAIIANSANKIANSVDNLSTQIVEDTQSKKFI